MQIILVIFGISLCACSDQDRAPETPASVTYKFTPKEITNLVMATQGFLNGHLPETGELEDGSTLLIFEKNFAWAIGETSPLNTRGKQTRYHWKINKKGQIDMVSIPDTPDFAPEPVHCTLTKTKEYKRKFTKSGLPEKIDTVFICDDYPKEREDKLTFHLPLPLYPRTVFGQTTNWSFSPETTQATFLPNNKIKRQNPDDPDQYLYDPYEAGSYQNSLTIKRTTIVETEEGKHTETVGMGRLLMFGHIVPRHSTLLYLSYSPVLSLANADNNQNETTTDRYELHSILRIKNLVFNPYTGENYEDSPTDIARSVNANQPPLKSAIVFK